MEKLAKAILEAQRIHEESWDADRKEYKLSQTDAAKQACGEDMHMAGLVCLLNVLSWNDAQDWANTGK